MTDPYEQLFVCRDAPEDLREAARAAGWPDDLLQRLVAVRRDEQWLRDVIKDRVPLERLESIAAEVERLTYGTMRVRLATRWDGTALSELYRASPEEVGDWEVTVERGPNAMAQFDLQEHAMVVLLEDRGVPLAAFAQAAKNVLVGGQPMSVRQVGAWRTRLEARGRGFSALIRGNWGPAFDLPFTGADYWYIRSQNAGAVAWMNALDVTLLGTTRQRSDDVPGIPASVHELPAAPSGGDEQGIRQAGLEDLSRCVALINRTHRDLDLFRPYTEEYLANKLDERFWGDRPPWWQRNYGWEDFYVVERDGSVVACAGLWDRGRDLREIWRNTTTGEERVDSVTNVLDLGCARGKQAELARLIRFLSRKSYDLGRNSLVAPLQFLPGVARSLADLHPRVTTRGLAWRMYGPEGTLDPPPVEPLRPYTDLAYW